MKTLITTLKRNSIAAIIAIAMILGFSASANAQTRSFTNDVLDKTDYVLNEAYEINEYFYYDDGELLSKATYFQDYAYSLYDARQYNAAVQYSLRARSYAINSIEGCDDYWEYYDYNYYGYSDVWGRNPNFSITIGNRGVQLHFGISNAPYHNNHRVNWNLYYTTREWNYYNRLPSEIIMLNNFYNVRGRVYFNDRHRNPEIYSRMRVRMNTGRDRFIKSYPHMTHNMAPRPRDIRPSNARIPSNAHDRREPIRKPNDNHNVGRPNNNNRPNVNNNNRPDNNRPNVNNNNRPDNNNNNNNNRPNVNNNRPNNNNNNNVRPNNNNNQNNSNRPTINNNNNNTNRPTTNNNNNNNNRPTINNNGNNSNRPSNNSSNVNNNRPASNNNSANRVNNNSNRSQDRQARREIKERTQTVTKSSSATSSSNNSSSRRNSGSTTSSSRRR